jgi:GT2 family glycosyltransferase
MTGGPEIAVAVATRDRPVRLRWLLNALEEQTLAPERFEVVVADGSTQPQTGELLRTHPLARAGVLRRVEARPEPGPARNRNRAWRASRAPLVAFTDDDCRPPADWLEQALEAAARNPGAVLQGRTEPDPDEAGLIHASAHARTQRIVPPTVWAEACNIVYPREVLERLGGFEEDEPLEACEDTDLALRARAAGVPYVAAPDVLTYHAVEAVSLRDELRATRRWSQLPWLAKRHPVLRDDCTLRIFWTRRHLRTTLALAGVALAPPTRGASLALAVPFVRGNLGGYGPSLRGRLRGVLELPGRAAVDLAELAVLARASARHRSLLL